MANGNNTIWSLVSLGSALGTNLTLGNIPLSIIGEYIYIFLPGRWCVKNILFYTYKTK